MARFDLPDITFAEKSVEQIEREVIGRYEAAIGKKLSPADPRILFLKAIVAMIAQQRSVIDYSGKQNLLAYAQDAFLDHIGAGITPRLKEQYAKTTIRFHLSTNKSQTIKVGTRGTAGDGIFFATKADVTFPTNQLYVDIEAECTVPGEIGNGYQPGEINQLVDPIQWVARIENITTSEGGADTEADDPYAERIRIAPESFSVAGPEGAYQFFARSASQLIVDVAVRNPSDGVVEIRPLLQGGQLPDQEMLDLVLAACSERKVRPLTDKVQVLAPEQVNYDLTVSYWIPSSMASLESSIKTAVEQAVEDYKTWQKSKLGRDIDPSELVAKMKAAGAKRVVVTLPTYQKIEDYQVAVENAVTVMYGGLEDD
ncbi:baseplate J/gp47 family protein [Brevibacillus composti]|uniref:Baseplate J/gp47 family protein n=1 Tax=Brevibacillus composti TaxID=2796470 RepID=A0A7T5EN81_9BACL|nr:baseplate J/gp47 family protein [Brevibacillus composti]QQE75729.1 baseplate J/gp47 family protein [Brevibacillus composti]QUO42755.1 baseplate J/gp47 family protein [Brevibacillus composti]